MSESTSPSSSISSPAPEDVELRPSSVAEKEAASLQNLFDLMEEFTPYMGGTFVFDKEWWEEKTSNCGLQVRPFSLNSCHI